MKDICIHHAGICFSVAYATEMLGVISILCDDQDAICDAGQERCNAAYREDVLRYFSAWKGSEVTKMLERLSDDYNFNYDAPVELLVRRCAGAPIDREALCLHRKLIPQEVFEHFLALLDRFEAESGFAAFYAAHQEMYRQAIRHFIADHDLYQPHGFLTEFADGTEACCFHVNLMFGVTNASYSCTVGKHVYAHLCPYGRSRYAPLPDYSCSAIYWTTLIAHEFAHAFVNPATARYREQIAGICLERYRQILADLMYGQSLETYINETVIRAMECIYVERNFPAEYEAYVQEYERDGFIHIRRVVQVLAGKVKTYCDCAEEIIRLF